MSNKVCGRPFPRPIAQFLTILLVLLFTVIAACGGGGDNNNKSNNPVPVLTSLSPTSTTVGGAAFTLTVNGSSFVTGSVVQWNGAARTTTYVGSTQLTAAIPATDLASTGTAQVTVLNPTPGGGTSASVAFAINNGVPIAASLSPASVTAGNVAFDLTVSGSGFVQGATVQWNDVARTTTFVSSNVLKAAIAAADVATVGTAQVKVVNPPPVGGTSGALTFTVQPIVPAITSLNPGAVLAGSAAFELTVNGTSFVQGATVRWNGSSRTTTYVSATELHAAIAAADIAAAGYQSVTVLNPAPNGGTSPAVQFTVSSTPSVASKPERVTVAPDGSPPNGPSVNGGMDWDGRYIIFASKASNLVTGDTNGAYDIFVRDTCGYSIEPCVPKTTRLTIGVGGVEPNGDSGSTATYPDNGLAVSFDGKYVAFVSSASNLVAGDANGVDDVFMINTCIGQATGCTPKVVQVSVRVDGSQAAVSSGYPSIADDGRYVAFVSADNGLVAGDSNGVADVFLRDITVAPGGATPSVIRISVAADGKDADGSSGAPSFNGRYLAFASSASNLVAGDTNGLADVFMRDTCIGASGSCAPATERISVGAGGVQADGVSSDPQLPPNFAWGWGWEGRYIAFVSSATNLVPADTNGVADVFVRDSCRGQAGCTPSTMRVSVTNVGGQVAGQPSSMPDFVRWDGETIPFVTAANGVVPEDTNGVADVYVRHMCQIGSPTYCTPSTQRVSVGVGGVQGDKASYSPRMNHDPWGANIVTFTSDATNLVPGTVPSPYYGSIFKTTVD